MSWDVLTPGPGATAGPPGPPGAQGPAGIPAAHHATHETGGADAIVALAGSVITSGTIADARLSANVALKTIDNAFVAQTLASGTWIRGASAMLYFWDTGSPVDAKGWRFANFADGLFRIQALNDSLSAVQGEPLTLGRTGNVSIGGHAMVAGRLQVGSTAGLSASFPALRNTGAALEVVLGDNSNWATVSAASYYAQYVGTSLADLTVRGATTFQSTLTAASFYAQNAGNSLADLTVRGATNFQGGVFVSAGGANITGVIQGSSYLQTAGVLYPGRIDTGVTQASWSLASHPTYGLYSNTGCFFGANLVVGNGAGINCAGVLIVNHSGSLPTPSQMYLGVNSAVIGYGISIANVSTGSAGYMVFMTSAPIFAAGAITQVGTAAQVLYSTSSDARLKTDLGRATDLTRLRQLVIHDFLWIADGARDRGLFAQEAHALFPRAIVEGSEDLTPDGVTLRRPWMADYSKFVADLIVGWQQHDAEIAALRAELATLKQRIA